MMIPLFWTAWQTVRDPSSDHFMTLAFMLGVVMVGFYARAFPVGVQNRVIRLEERLRMREVLPESQQGLIDGLTTAQLIGLRFASDEELPELVAAVAAEEVTDPEDIKKRVKNWRK